jgi:hypothetical protein
MHGDAVQQAAVSVNRVLPGFLPRKETSTIVHKTPRFTTGGWYKLVLVCSGRITNIEFGPGWCPDTVFCCITRTKAGSSAHGDAGSMQFEGISSGMDDYSSGFGVIAEPSQQLVALDSNDTWVWPPPLLLP